MGDNIITKTAGAVVINPSGKILVVIQLGGSWSLPKGHIEKDETALETARREIYEESGIKDLEFIKKLGSYERYKIGKDGGDDKSELKQITIFVFKTKTTKTLPIDSHNQGNKWLSKYEVLEQLTHQKDKEFFEKHINEV